MRSWENWDEPDSARDARLVADAAKACCLLGIVVSDSWLCSWTCGWTVVRQEQLHRQRAETRDGNLRCGEAECAAAVFTRLWKGGREAKGKWLSFCPVASIRKSRLVLLPPPASFSHLLVFILSPYGWVERWAVRASWVGWGTCALQSLSCRLGYSVQSSCAAESCREPCTFKRKGCSLAPPWLFLIFVFCQLLEVHKMSILRTLLSCDRSWGCVMSHPYPGNAFYLACFCSRAHFSCPEQ